MRWSDRFKSRPRAIDEDCPMARDCVVLLSYVSAHPNERQTFRRLSDATGIPLQTVWAIVRYAYKEGELSILSKVAKKYGFSYKVYPERDRNGVRKESDRIIDAVRWCDWAYSFIEKYESREGEYPSIDSEGLNEVN